MTLLIGRRKTFGSSILLPLLSRCLFARRTSTFLTGPSDPGKVEVITPTFHSQRAIWLSSNITTSPALRFSLSLVHFCRRLMTPRYSVFQATQKSSTNAWETFQLLDPYMLSFGNSAGGGAPAVFFIFSRRLGIMICSPGELIDVAVKGRDGCLLH